MQEERKANAASAARMELFADEVSKPSAKSAVTLKQKVVAQEPVFKTTDKIEQHRKRVRIESDEESSEQKQPKLRICKPDADEDDDDDDDVTFDNITPVQRSDSTSYVVPSEVIPSGGLDSTAGIIAEETVTEVKAPVVPSRKIGKKASIFATTVEEDEVEEVNDNPFTVFSKPGLLFDGVWNSKLDPVDQVFTLSDFNTSDSSKQTIAVRITVPKGSVGWALNITPVEDLALSDIYVHFNPRYNKGFIMLNDRKGTWGAPLRRKLGSTSTVEPIMSTNIDLIIHITPYGFLFFVNNVYLYCFSHRRDIFGDLSPSNDINNSSSGYSSGRGNSSAASRAIHALKLIIPAKDGNGFAEEVIVNKVSYCVK